MEWRKCVFFGVGLLLVACYPLAAQRRAVPVGDGLQGAYYQGRNFEQLRQRQVDTTLNFYRRHQPPAEGVPAEDSSARWTGWLLVPASGHYVLHLDVDDGARLWLDGRLLLDEWRGQPLSSYTLDLDLRAGQAYALRLDYCQYGADSYAQLALVRPEQLAQFKRAASWRNLWGLVTARPLPTVIPTRYLFTHYPTRPLRLASAAPVVRRPVLPVLPTKPIRLVARRRPPAAVGQLATRTSYPPLAGALPASPLPVGPASQASQLRSGQALLLPAVYFAQGKADLLPSSRQCLDTLITLLKQQPGLRLQVQGHTDNQGDSALNRQLSQQRPAAVCRYLVASGISVTRLQARGYGGTHPLTDNRVPARNRRVAVQLLL